MLTGKQLQKFGRLVLFGLYNLEDEGTTGLQNVGIHLPVNTAQYPRRLDSTETLPCEIKRL
jgi:hypothetical protein